MGRHRLLERDGDREGEGEGEGGRGMKGGRENLCHPFHDLLGLVHRQVPPLQEFFQKSEPWYIY